MKIESLEEAIMTSALTGLPLKVMLTEKMLKMTQEQYEKCVGSCLCLRCRKDVEDE